MRGGGQIRRRRKTRPGEGRRVHCKPQGGEASRRLAGSWIAAGASVRSAFCSNWGRSTRWAAFFSRRGRRGFLARTSLHSSVRNGGGSGGAGAGSGGGNPRRLHPLCAPSSLPPLSDPRSQPAPAVQSSFPNWSPAAVSPGATACSSTAAGARSGEG